METLGAYRVSALANQSGKAGDRPRVLGDVSGQTDGEVVLEVLGGSPSAVDELFRRCWPTAWWSAFAVLGERSGADDAAQDAIERAFRSLRGFDQTRPLRPWVGRIASNLALNRLRSGRREVLVAEPHPNGTGPDGAQGLEQRDELMAALRALSVERRTVVALRYFGDLEPAEIAVVLDVPVGTVYSRLSRALSELRGLLEVHP